MLGRSILTSGLGVLLFASTTVAQPGGFPGGGFPGGPGGGGGAFELPKPGQILTNFLQEQLKLKDEQKKQVGDLQKEVDTKLDKVFTDDQKKQWKEMKDNPGRGGPGGPGGRPGGGGPGGPGGGGPGGGGPGGPMRGFGGFPQPGQIMAVAVQEELKLTDEQKKQVDDLQKEVDTALDKVFTDDQKKQWKEIKDNMARGPGGRPGGGPGGGGFGGPGGGFGGPGGGGFGMNRLDDVKKQLAATDEEWKVISPKIQKVISARQVLNDEGGNFGGGFGGGFGGATGSSITQAKADLKAVLDDTKHTNKEVEEKIAAVRKARQKARDELAATQKDLAQMLTKSQEAALISLGYLD